MIDDDDANDVWLAALITPGGAGFALLLVAVIIAVIASSNRADCSRMHCSPGKSAKLMQHECLCVERAR